MMPPQYVSVIQFVVFVVVPAALVAAFIVTIVDVLVTLARRRSGKNGGSH